MFRHSCWHGLSSSHSSTSEHVQYTAEMCYLMEANHNKSTISLHLPSTHHYKCVTEHTTCPWSFSFTALTKTRRMSYYFFGVYQCNSRTGYRVYCYIELTVVVWRCRPMMYPAMDIHDIHYAYHKGVARLSRPVWLITLVGSVLTRRRSWFIVLVFTLSCNLQVRCAGIPSRNLVAVENTGIT